MSEPEGTLRLLRSEDIAAAFALSAQAGWNQTEDDWRTLLELAPQSCWGIETDGVLTATTTLLCYGRRLAWIGMVLTRADFQRRGLAKTLFAKAVDQADALGIATVKLDATDQGQGLYEKFGFVVEREIERWVRAGDSPNIPAKMNASEISSERDEKVFGADRSELLARLARRGSVFEESKSYLLARPGRVNAYMGPCIAGDADVARQLVERCVRDTSCGWAWDLFPSNAEAAAIARDLGFAPKRYLLRMSRGKELKEDVKSIYAIAGFELG